MAIRTGTPGNDTLTGTQFADSLFGLDGNDILRGLGNNDSLDGGDGDDSLIGSDGNDTLDGGFGTNTLDGGNGNDTYKSFSTDIITEAVNSGIDTVLSRDSYTLGSNLENLTLTDEFVPVKGRGNSLNNKIIGNAANNLLEGGAGNDSLIGRAGNDTLVGGFGVVGEKDTLTGGVGIDTFILGDFLQDFSDDHNTATAGTGDYALIKDFKISEDIIKLNGRRSDYRLAATPAGLPTGIAIYLNKPTGEKDELIAIVQGSSSLSLNGNYFRFNSVEINVSNLNGRNGFVLNSPYSVSSISEAGDINGDGFNDLIIGASNAAPNGQRSAGSSYVVFGKAGGFDTSIDLSTLNGNNGFVINGTRFDNSGTSVSDAGDVNGDGFDDLLIGSPNRGNFDTPYYGASYVVFGKEGGFSASFNLANINGSNGFYVGGPVFGGFLGSNIDSAGDINGDGFDDLLFGVPYSGSVPSPFGKSYVVFGKVGGFSADGINLSNLDGNGFVLDGDGISGSSVSRAGDINGDGFDDLLVGAYYYGQAGKSYVVFGKKKGFAASFDLSSLNGNNGFVISSDVNNFSVSGVSEAGDLNGDGFDDLLIKASYREGITDKSYVVFGKAGGFSASLDVSVLDGSNGFVLSGSGNSISGAGDVNSDGFDDIIIGSPYSQNENYVVFGKEGFNASLDLSQLNGSNGFVLKEAGSLVSSAGDVNGDGFDDIMSGTSIIFGTDFTDKVTRTGTAGNDTLTGTVSDDILIGGLGNDRLIGGRGVDVLYGGAGNDTLSFGAIDRRLNGGSGRDTLTIDTSGITMDLTQIANNKISEFEIIDITGTGNNSLNFTRLDVLNLSDTTNRLIVNGNAGDKVTSTGQGWAFGGTTTLNSILYDRYTVGAATLLVDADITQTIT